MIIALILILTAVALFLILRDDHDRSYSRNEPKSGRENGRKSIYQKSAAPRRNAPVSRKPDVPTGPTPPPAPAMGPRTIVPEEKQYRPRKLDERLKPDDPQPKYASAPPRMTKNDVHPSAFAYGAEKTLDFSYLDELDYDPDLPEKTMSSFIAGLQGYCTRENLAPSTRTTSSAPSPATSASAPPAATTPTSASSSPLPAPSSKTPSAASWDNCSGAGGLRPHKPPLRLPGIGYQTKTPPPRIHGIFSLAQVGPISGAGGPTGTRVEGRWRRYARFLAQVCPIPGAGGVFGGGPAPQNGLLRTTLAQVSTLFPHLRQHTPTPAPKHRHLHRVPAAPAPKTSAPAPKYPYTCTT